MLIRLLRRYVRPFRGPIVLTCLLQLILVIAALWLPTLNADIIDYGVARGDTGYILRLGAVMLGASLVQAGLNIVAVYYGSQVAMGIGRDIRAQVFRQVQTFSEREVAHFGAPSLITRTTNDVQQVQMLVQMLLTMIVQAPIMLAGAIIMSMRQDVTVASWMLLLLPAMAALMGFLIWKAAPLFRSMQAKIDTLNGVLREQITGVRVVRAFVREEAETARFGTASADLRDTQTRVGVLMAFTFPMVFLIGNVASVAVLWFGGHRIDAGQMQVGALTAFIAYIMQIIMSLMLASMVFFMLPRAQVCAERINEVLDTETTVVAPAHPASAGISAGRVELKNVEFTYPGADQPVLADINFAAEPGTTTAVIGATGAGKTTLINLIPRLYDVTGGQVLLDGTDVRALEPPALWRVGLVPQKAYLFSGTIASNLRYGNQQADDAALWRALDIAQARDFVQALPAGLDAPVAQGGTNFSGGQRQRLAIARALVSQAKVLLFDDSFSALDYATDAALRAALSTHVTDAAIIVVAQRVATIRHAHRIYVLEAGRVVACGTHAELLASSPTYEEIVLSQLAAEEAA